MKILVINNVVPNPDQSGADLRLLKVLQALVRLGNDVTLVALKRSSSTKTLTMFEALGIPVHHGDANQLSFYGKYVAETFRFEQLVRQQSFDLAIMSLWYWGTLSMPEHYLDLLRVHSPQTIVAILTDDRHGDRQTQIAKLDPCLIEIECAFDHTARELEAYRRCSLVIAISAREEEYVTQQVPQCKCFVVPFAPDPHPSQNGFTDREGLCFLGNFQNTANRASYDILIQRILPIVRFHLGNIPLFVGGLQSQSLAPNALDGVHLLGPISELPAFFNKCRLFVSPTPFGTGITTKVAVAMAHGIPVLTTPAGSQSLGAINGTHLLCEDDYLKLAQSTVELYHNEQLWNMLSDNAMGLIRNNSLERVESALRQVLLWVSEQPVKIGEPMMSWSTRRGIQNGKRSQQHRAGIVESFIAAGCLAFQNGDPSEAIVQFRHAISLNKSGFREDRSLAPTYLFLLGQMYRAYLALSDTTGCRRVRNERRWYRQILQLSPSDEV